MTTGIIILQKWSTTEITRSKVKVTEQRQIWRPGPYSWKVVNDGGDKKTDHTTGVWPQLVFTKQIASTSTTHLQLSYAL